MKHGYFKTIFLFAATFALGFSAGAEEPNALPNDDLQKILDSGKDLVLKKGETYYISRTLALRRNGQKVYTADAKTVKDYATLKADNPEMTATLVSRGKNQKIKNVIFHGNRYELSPRRGDGMVHVGGKDSGDCEVKECFFAYGRMGTLLKLDSPAKGIKVFDCIMFGGGGDCRGNGAAQGEPISYWGDTMTCSAQQTHIKNNLMIDPSDVGIAIFCAPDSLIEENVVAGVSREPLGGFNMVDRAAPYKVPNAGETYSYDGLVLRNNIVDARGAKVHIAFPMGRQIWGFGEKNMILRGATVENNLITGKAMGYGFVVFQVDNFKVINNKSTAIHSGVGDGTGNLTPPKAAAFYAVKDTYTNCTLQKEFVVSDGYFVRLLRNGKVERKPTTKFCKYEYTRPEAEAVVETAFVEMLGRNPGSAELEKSIAYLNSPEKPSGDDFRRSIMNGPEFKKKFPQFKGEDELHEFRYYRWIEALDAIQNAYLKKTGVLPTAKQTYAEIWNYFTGKPLNIAKNK